MNPKIFIFHAGLVLLATSILAEPAATGVPGSMALRIHQGNPAAWEIRSTMVSGANPKGALSGETQPGGAALPSLGADAGQPVARKLVVRVGNITRILEETPPTGTLIWIVDGYELQTALSPGTNVLVLPIDGEITNAHDYSRTDFPELSWILDKTASGQQRVRGRTCLVFQSSDGRIAYLDAATGLPVRSIHGIMVDDYDYPAPPAQLQLPEKAASVLANHRNRLRALFP